jgi:hypothetical protein
VRAQRRSVFIFVAKPAADVKALLAWNGSGQRRQNSDPAIVVAARAGSAAT